MLYLATLDLQAFLKIRREQNIFVEFSQFGEKFQALLDFCVQNGANDDDISNRFICVLNQNATQEEDNQGAVLNIYEHNDFRNLLHIRLHFKQATAEETSQWLAKKLLMHRKLNIDLQQETVDLNEQHDQDRQRINQIKQSLLALKATQNEELQRIKDDHEGQLEQAEESKARLIDDLKRQYEGQIQDLTSEFEQRLSEIKNDANSLRDELSKSQSNQKQQSELISERETRIEELSCENDELKHEREKLQSRVDDLKDQNSELEKRLIETTLLREQFEKEFNRKEQKVAQLKGDIENLQNQQRENQGTIESLRESLMLSSEQGKHQESELARLEETIGSSNNKISELKAKRTQLKSEIKEVSEEKFMVEQRCNSLSENIDQLEKQISKLQGELEGRNKLIDSLEEKLKEDQQILFSNKNLIEYLNKTLNDAQKTSFRTIVSQQRKDPATIQDHHSQSKFNTISPMRGMQNAGVPRLETSKLQETAGQATLSSNRYQKNHRPQNTYGSGSIDHMRAAPQIPQEMLYQPPAQGQLALPMTEYYLSKSNGTNNYLSFGGANKPPVSGYQRQTYSASTRQFNHILNNPFASQLERERIISEEKLKQRFDDAYTSKYQGEGQKTVQTNLYSNQFHGDTPILSQKKAGLSHKDLALPLQQQHDRSYQQHQESLDGVRRQIVDINFREVEVLDDGQLRDEMLRDDAATLEPEEE